MGLKYVILAVTAISGGAALANSNCSHVKKYTRWEADQRAAYKPSPAQENKLRYDALKKQINDSLKSLEENPTTEAHRRGLEGARTELQKSRSPEAVAAAARKADLEYGVNRDLFATEYYSRSTQKIFGDKYYPGYKHALHKCLQSASGTLKGERKHNLETACDYKSGDQYVDEKINKKKFAHISAPEYMVNLPSRLDEKAMEAHAPYNMHVLRNIAELGQGGGYHLGGPGMSHNVTVQTKDGKASLHKVDPSKAGDRKHNSSFCAGATFSVFTKTMNDVGAFKKLNKGQVNQFKSAFGGDNRNFRGMWMNSEYGQVDACAMGNLHKDERFCRSFEAGKNKGRLIPGDFIQIARKPKMGLNGKVNRAGHSAIFLGWADKEKKKMIYWSSHGSTGGYGVKTEDTSRFKSVYGTRITNPHALKNIQEKTFQKNNNGKDEEQMLALYKKAQGRSPSSGESNESKYRKAWLAGGDPLKALACGDGSNPGTPSRSQPAPVRTHDQVSRPAVPAAPKSSDWASNFFSDTADNW